MHMHASNTITAPCWGLRCETAARTIWLDVEPMTEREARTMASKFSPHPARTVTAAPLDQVAGEVRYAFAA